MKGAFVVDVAANGLEATRGALARAVASGAFGTGYVVRRDGDGFAFAGAASGRVDVTSDGRVAYAVELPATFERWATATVVAALVASAATIGWSARFPVALAVGVVAGVAYFVAMAAQDRARLRCRVRALVDSLPVLVDARGQ
jgi:hypothetical protein